MDTTITRVPVLILIVTLFLFFSQVTACGEIETHSELRTKITSEFELPLRSISHRENDVLRLVFRATPELRALDSESEELRKIARFSIEHFEKGMQIQHVEIIIEEISSSAVTTAASRTTHRISVSEL